MKRQIENKKLFLFRSPVIFGMIVLILVFSLSLTWRQREFRQEEVLVITEDRTGINIEYTPGLELIDINMNGKQITKFMIKDGVADNIPGAYGILYINVIERIN